MKIMRLDSWSEGWACRRGGRTMRHGMTASPQMPSGTRATDRRLSMQWQTPTATDFRFGFEITMYVAAR
jgi:coenzyme PQQ precursor peptide PqqA